MSVLDALPEAVAAEVSDLQRAVNQLQQQADRRFSDRRVFDIALAIDGMRATEPRILGVGAFGAGSHRDDLELAASIFIADPAPERPTPDWLLLDRLAPELPDGATVVVLPVPRPQAHPGGPARCLGQDGHFGARAHRAGRDGILAAGHVARTVGTTVDDGAGRAGTVEFSDDAPRRAPTEVCADVAFVSLDSAARGPAEPALASTRSTSIGDPVTAFARGQTRTAWVRGVVPQFLLDPAGGAWGEVYITSNAISTGGDSGAPVVLGDGDELVGHVIAGHEGIYSIVQDAGFQLRECGASLVIT